MGYNTKTVTTRGYQEMVGASFNSVGAEALDIQDITLVGDAEDGSSWIKWWDPATRTYSAKAYYVANFIDPETDDDLDYGGWGDNDWAPLEKTFAPGEGFWFSPNRANVGITTAGSVEQTANKYVGRKVDVRGQQIMVINAFPTVLDIQNVVLEGDAEDGSSWIKWWDSATRTYSAKAYYVSNFIDPETDEDLDYGGWGDNDWAPLTKSFAVGDGFWFSPNRANVIICFPNPFYKTTDGE